MALNEACAKLEETVNSYIFHKNEDTNLKLREELVDFIGRNDTIYTSVRILIPAFTSSEQKNLGPGHELLETGIIWLLDYALSVNDVRGVTINPFGEQINLDRDSIRSLLRAANVEEDFEKKDEA